MATRYPISVDRLEHCKHCNETTVHQWRVYPDHTWHRCTRCGHEHTTKYEDVAELLADDAMPAELDHISDELNTLGGSVMNHHWGNIGKKDRSFLEWVLSTIFHVKTHVDRLRK